jgi:repressor LexA
MTDLTVVQGGNADDLSARQRAILEFIRDRIDAQGVPPSYREIGHAMGIRSTNGVSDHIKALIRKEYLTRIGEGGKSLARSLVLTDKAVAVGFDSARRRNADGMREVHVYGQVAAGTPLLAEENREATLRVDSFLLPGRGEVFALRVFGESMIDDGIFHGDYIFVRKQLEVPDGEIVVVMVDGDATVKRLYREGDRVRLQPANETMEPIYVAADEFRDVSVIGAVVGVYRKLD